MKNKRKLVGILLFITIIVSSPLLSICHDNKNYFIEDNYEICLSPGENETMLNFSWYSNESNDSQIKIINKSKKEKIYKGSSKKIKDNLYSNKVTVTDLKDNTTYYYSYKFNGVWSKLVEFKTKDSNEFSFVFMGDPQIGSSSKKMNSVQEGINKDALNWNKVINKALERDNHLSFIVCGGDETNTKEYNSRNREISNLEYGGFLSPKHLRYIPVASAIGNHDEDNENFYNHFHLPNSSSLGRTTAGGDYYFNYGNCMFLFLNTNNLDINEHEKFIENVIKKNKNIKWKIVVFHHDIYGDGVHSNDKDVEFLRNELPKVLEKNKIDLVLCGHDHIYSRTYTLKNNKKTREVLIEGKNRFNENIETLNNPKGIIYITGNSSTGSKFYDKTNKKQDYVKFKYDKERPAFTIINVSKNKIIICTYKVDNGKRIDNKIIVNKNKYYK